MAMVQWSMKIPQELLDRLQNAVELGYFKNKNSAAVQILSQSPYLKPKHKLQKEKK